MSTAASDHTSPTGQNVPASKKAKFDSREIAAGRGSFPSVLGKSQDISEMMRWQWVSHGEVRPQKEPNPF